MIRTLLAIVICVVAMIPPASSPAQQINPPVGPNWCNLATAAIESDHGRPFRCATAGRCIKMNNYGCVKQPASGPLPGTTWGSNSEGARDSKDHAIFEAPQFSLLRIIATYRNYQQSGRRSALQIEERYSPWCDTLGSAVYNRGWGRSCRGERKPAAPVGYTPMCSRPANGLPSSAQCSACNCPNRAASLMVAGTTFAINDPLPLFDERGRALPLMVNIIIQRLRQEQSVRLKRAVAEAAIAEYNMRLPSG